MNPAIAIRNVSKFFPKRRRLWHSSHSTDGVIALDHVSWTVDAGKIVALVGPNGAGKTTLLRILSTLVIPDEGDIQILGYMLPAQAPLARQVLGYAMGEDRSFYWRLTVRQNLDFFAALYNLTARESRQKIQEVSGFLDLEDVLDRRFETLSTGTRQRVSLARSFLSNASIILADEPTRSLDPLSKNHFQELLLRLSREWGKTIFFTTHDLQEAERIADTIGILVKGRLQITGTPSVLKQNTLAHVYAQYCQTEEAHAPAL